MEDVIITSSRLQPLHRDHVEFWEHIQRSSDKHLIVCVLHDVGQKPEPEPDWTNTIHYQNGTGDDSQKSPSITTRPYEAKRR
jgi:hypothetical protein